jgi:sugar lactone lactonase YvrE
MTSYFTLAQEEKAVTGESPVWDAARATLWWIDIQGRRLLGLKVPGGPRTPVALPSEPGLVAVGSDGRLVIGLEDGLWTYTPEAGALHILAPMRFEEPNIRLNDGKPDKQGRLWFGSMNKTGSGAPVGGLFCRDIDGQVRQVRRDVRVPNAIAISPDGNTLYFADSPLQEILALELDQETGTLLGERCFCRYSGNERPDGTAVDTEGGLWVAVVNGNRIDRFLPDGTLDHSIPVPVSRPTMPAFGGAEMSGLFVTSQRRFLDEGQLAAQPWAGSLLETKTAVHGTSTTVLLA